MATELKERERLCLGLRFGVEEEDIDQDQLYFDEELGGFVCAKQPGPRRPKRVKTGGRQTGGGADIGMEDYIRRLD